MTKAITDFFNTAVEAGFAPHEVPLLAAGLILAKTDPKWNAAVAGMKVGNLLRELLTDKGWTAAEIAAITEEDILWMFQDFEKGMKDE